MFIMKQGIPKKFVRKYGSDLPDLVFLQVASGDAWEVELVRGYGGVWLRRGWPDFAKHYAIEQGHFLVFRYEGGSAFRVVIFDKSASEIEYPIISDLPKREENEGDTLAEAFEGQSDQTRELPSSTLLSPPLKKKKKKKRTNEHLNKQAVGGAASNIVYDVNAGLKSGYWGRCRPFKGSAKSEALKRAASFQSPNPFFLTLMQPSLIHHSLNAPAKFFMEHIPSYRSGGDIDLYVSNERFWSARYRFGIYSRKLQVKINGGWKLFAQDNNLKVGDVCVFELTTKVDRVSFRVCHLQSQPRRNRTRSNKRSFSTQAPNKLRRT
ncbi:B3 domain-containing protein Os11g0197600-like [Syzygium oleosum]|uniref:B3 domain-containing protein Os11g0197600-like n=1 Tax=Syzygium oleosum TaxID=219896 RepID=UPI0024BB17C4|nr:B3 domain-containing protein Os11g0197600-like [Syzygium oleosum]